MELSDDRCVVVTIRPAPGGEAECWLTLYDGPEVSNATLRGNRGPVGIEDLPFHLYDAMIDVMHHAHSLWPRIF